GELDRKNAASGNFNQVNTPQKPHADELKQQANFKQNKKNHKKPPRKKKNKTREHVVVANETLPKKEQQKIQNTRRKLVRSARV
ncbi:hypothetical protein ACQWG3_24695, partial [Salmonella enterica subsp. enterica serovar Infantis]